METEFDNIAALSLYESLGFIREKRLFRFYLNGKDAFRLVLVVPPSSESDDDDKKVDTEIARAFKSTYQYLAPPRMIAIPALSYNSNDDISTR